ncbi:DUF3862 domain-containing protein [Thermoflavimicrobium daqui]|uniref:DUF3862 domain-containing protein n=1 Tax=Thermoflavimicrobium daqui TaxID=2137476 RepID=A0A364K166_9BACL|nr:DUF3862 domain-containing protein [Thermoflavimicrobium daqui]RAL21426.1 hypothetical protein DL897_16405 [Thermoflavimicrobium daqui]
MKKWLLGIGAFIVIAAMIGAMNDDGKTSTVEETTQAATSESSSQENSTPEPSSQPVEQNATENKEVTMEKFKQIKSGMSYEEVVKIIGFEGTEMSSNELAGIKTVMYSWQNDDGSNMNAMFQNNKLNSKAQFGLK